MLHHYTTWKFMAQRFIHVLVYIWFAQTQTSSLHLFAIQSLGTWAPTAFTPMHDSQLCTYSRSSGLWSFVEFMSFALIYHQTNRCRYQNTTPKNLLSNMFPFTPAKKKNEKPEIAAAACYCSTWLNCIQHLPLAICGSAGWPQQPQQLWRRIRWSEFGGKTWKTLWHTKKLGKNIF